jgi:hypothetical protein
MRRPPMWCPTAPRPPNPRAHPHGEGTRYCLVLKMHSLVSLREFFNLRWYEGGKSVILGEVRQRCMESANAEDLRLKKI